MKTFLTTSLLLSSAATLAQSPAPADTIPEMNVDLEEFVVVADKPVVQSDGAKLTYNMSEDPSSKGNTLLDAIKKVPMLSVDGEDNIRLNGQQNFKIYVNGKEDPSLSANYKNIFKAMPAEAVEKIEVITEPGAKYDAEGTAGIINLITITKNTTDGYSGTLSASFSKRQTGGSFYGRMRKGKFALSANVDYADGWLFKQSNSGEGTTEYLNSPTISFQKDNSNQEVGFRYTGGGLHLSYDLSDKDLITADATVYTVDGAVTKGSFFSSSLYDKMGNLSYFAKRDLTGDIANTGLNAGASWQHQFNDKGRNLVLSYLFNYGYNKLDAAFEIFRSEGQQLQSPFERNFTRSYNREHTVQLDYSNPFLDGKHTVEAGGKAIWRRNSALSEYFYGLSPETATESTDNRSDLTQKQDIYALYASYSGNFGNFKATAGVRYEHTDMGMDFHWGQYEDFMKALNDVVPNAAITYSFSTASNLRLAYQMRITRPSLNSVNPYRLSLNLNQVQMGNPDLESEKANKISLTFSKFGNVVGGNVGVEYSAINNSISSVSYAEGDIVYDTYANIGTDRRVALFGYFSWNMMKRMQFSLNARISHIDLSSSMPYHHNSGWSVNYGANWNYTLPIGIKLNLYGGQQTRNYQLQGYNSGWYYYGLGISKSFLKKDALTVSLSASDFLQDRERFKSFSETDHTRESSVWTSQNWNVGISVSWNFGSLSSDVKKTSKSINNDDQSSAGQKSGVGL